MVEHSNRPNWSDLSIGQISHIFLLLVKTWHMEKGKKKEWKNGKKEKKKLDAVTTAPTGVPTRFSFKTWTHTVTSDNLCKTYFKNSPSTRHSPIHKNLYRPCLIMTLIPRTGTGNSRFLLLTISVIISPESGQNFPKHISWPWPC